MRAVFLLTLTAALAAAQNETPPPRPAVPLLARSLPYLSDPNLHKELKVDAAGAEKMNALAEKAFTRLMNARDAATTAALTKELERDLAFLTDAQRLRLRQLMIQTTAGISVISARRSLLADEEISRRMKWTDKQKADLADGKVAVAEVLTPGQKKEWEALNGPPYAGRLVMSFGRGSGFAPPLALVDALTTKQIAEDLSLTVGQRDGLTKINERWKASTAKGRDTKFREVLEAEAEKLLTDSQRRRLEQLRRQSSLSFLRPHERLTSPTLAADLKLTEAQRKAIAAESAGRRAELLKLFAPEADPTAVEKALSAFHDVTAKKLDAILTPEQIAARADLLGRPAPEGAGTFLRLPRRGPRGPQPALKVVTMGTRLLGSPGLHADIGASPAQAKALADATGRGFDIGDRAERALSLLDEKQRTRLGQILLQHYARIDDEAGSRFPQLSRIAEIRDALKLTDAQIAATGPLTPILDATQKAALEKLLGPPYKGAALRSMARVREPLPPALGVLTDESAADEFVFPKSTWGKITEIVDKYRLASRGGFGGELPDPRAAQLAAERAAMAEVEKLLDDKQRRRLRELTLRRLMTVGVVAVLREPDVVAALKLTDEQKKDIEDLNARAGRLIDLLEAETGPRPGVGPTEAADKVREAIVAAGRKKVDGLLSDDQRAKLTALLGKPPKAKP